jgi:hypothetical protein
MWVGSRYYSRPSDWVAEAVALGVSKRLPGLIRGLVERIKDRTLVCYVAHPAAIWGSQELVFDEARPGIIAAFRPTAVELVVTEAMARERQVWAQRTGVQLRVVEAVDTDTEHVLL